MFARPGQTSASTSEALTASAVNQQLWRGDHVARYANRTLFPVEVVVLTRYQQALSGRVLEVGCGAGRVLGYLVELGGEVHGVDVSPAMVDYCRRTYPEAHVQTGDLRNLAATFDAGFDAIVATYNVIDVVDPEERRQALDGMQSLLAPDGLLILSAHNLAAFDRANNEPSTGAATAMLQLARISPAGIVGRIIRLPRQVRNRRRLRPLQRREADFAILNDIEGDYGALHYYVRRDDQARQLAEAGFALIECLDLDGREVPEGRDGTGGWLHYIARLS